jgi:hypothetical protein
MQHIAILGQVRYVFSPEALASRELIVLQQLNNLYNKFTLIQ